MEKMIYALLMSLVSGALSITVLMLSRMVLERAQTWGPTHRFANAVLNIRPQWLATSMHWSAYAVISIFFIVVLTINL